MTDLCGVETFEELCQNEVELAEGVTIEEACSELVNRWRLHCQSVNRRLAGTIEIKEESEEYNRILDRLPSNSDKWHLRKLVSKTDIFASGAYEASRFLNSHTVLFVPIRPDGVEMNGSEKHPHIPFPYVLKLETGSGSENICSFSIRIPSNVDSNISKWLKDKALPVMLKWLRNCGVESTNAPRALGTNQLVDIESYAKTYRRIKEMHGLELFEKWPEKTDPEKFVYEDCGIAAYLLEIFRKLNVHPSKFVDVGCGNGLLVYLLNKEGVKGVGLDIRRRKIWDGLFKGTELIESTVDPCTASSSSCAAIDEADFLIGNHSDELTPWMPIMAARLNASAFILPCCPFNFYGKMQSTASLSKYDAFLAFVRDVAIRIGFDVKEDRLSIPSTKRHCFVCTIPVGGLPKDLEDRISLLTAPSPGTTLQFVARPKLEKVSNCSQIPYEKRQSITHKMFTLLLNGEQSGSDADRKCWRKGVARRLDELISHLTDEEKALMKAQNGGLQTFLKNQHQVFQVRQGSVTIRDPRDRLKTSAEPAAKKKRPATPLRVSKCWMKLYHPDGCPLSEEECNFSHLQDSDPFVKPEAKELN